MTFPSRLQQSILLNIKNIFLCAEAVVKVTNVKNRHLQNDLLTAVICWTTFHQNSAVVAVNSIASLG